MVVYELTCPACKDVMRGSFVRLGAVVDCASCKRRFLVNADLVKRQIAPVSGEVLQRLSTEFASPGSAAAPMPSAPTTGSPPSAAAPSADTPPPDAPPAPPPKPRKRKWLLMLGGVAFAATVLTLMSLRAPDSPAVQYDIQSAAVSPD